MTRTRRLTILLNAKEFKALRHYAELNGLDLSGYVRRAILEQFRQDKEKPGFGPEPTKNDPPDSFTY